MIYSIQIPKRIPKRIPDGSADEDYCYEITSVPPSVGFTSESHPGVTRSSEIAIFIDHTREAKAAIKTLIDLLGDDPFLRRGDVVVTLLRKVAGRFCVPSVPDLLETGDVQPLIDALLAKIDDCDATLITSPSNAIDPRAVDALRTALGVLLHSFYEGVIDVRLRQDVARTIILAPITRPL